MAVPLNTVSSLCLPQSLYTVLCDMDERSVWMSGRQTKQRMRLMADNHIHLTDSVEPSMRHFICVSGTRAMFAYVAEAQRHFNRRTNSIRHITGSVQRDWYACGGDSTAQTEHISQLSSKERMVLRRWCLFKVILETGESIVSPAISQLRTNFGLIA